MVADVNHASVAVGKTQPANNANLAVSELAGVWSSPHVGPVPSRPVVPPQASLSNRARFSPKMNGLSASAMNGICDRTISIACRYVPVNRSTG